MPTAQLNTPLYIPDDLIQTQVNLFLKDLKEMGYDKQRAEDILQGILEQAQIELEIKIESSMNEEDKSKWEAFKNTNPNPTQEYITINKFLENKKGWSIEELQNEILTNKFKDTIKILQFTNDIAEKIANLSPELTEQAQKLLNQGMFDEAEEFINLNQPQ